MKPWYFAHPHDHQPGGIRLAQYLTNMTGIQLVNPFANQLRVGVDDPSTIVHADLGLIREAGGVFAWMPRQCALIGTSMEVFYASTVVCIPVVVYASPVHKNHPWLLTFGQVCYHIGDTLDALRVHAKEGR